MKVLICSKLFYPSNSIGAVRPSNFAKYLAELGHNVVVVTEERFATHDYKLNGVDIIRVSNSSRVQKLIQINQLRIDKRAKAKETSEFNNVTNKKRASQLKILESLKKFLTNSGSLLFMLFIEFDWYFSSLKVVKKKYKKEHFDIVISSYGPISSLLLGYHISKLGLANYWISDFRDNMINEEYPFWLNLIYGSIEKRIIKTANAITFISNGQKDMFLNNNKKQLLKEDKVFVVYNGYENDFISNPGIKDDKVLRITYTGQLYAGKRDLGLLFHVINDLIDENLIDKNKIEFLYAGQSSEDLISQMVPYKNIKYIYKNYGFVDRAKALVIQNKSDLLVVLSWNTKSEQGILTGKFLEYLQAYKPIIALTTGDLPNGELTEMVMNLDLGIACEYIAREKDYNRLKEYIVLQYRNIKNGSHPIFTPDLETIKTFHYRYITHKLNDICQEIATK
jgi:hypothetical protein